MKIMNGGGEIHHMKTSAMATEQHPAADPYRTDWLDVGAGHRLYVEQSGNPAGLPVVVLHGGPASGSSPRQRRFFDPSRYRIVLFDQRGSGRSTPAGGLADNTTGDLLADIERIRVFLAIERWLVFGGSWGATLALLYAGRHRDRCLGLVLRGCFLAENADLDWFFDGAAALAPDAWEAFASAVPRTGGESLRSAAVRGMAGDDPAVVERVARAWVRWEATLTRPGLEPAGASGPLSDGMVAKYRLQAAYLARQCDVRDGEVLAAAVAARGMPAAIVHGRLDFVCRPGASWRVAEAFGGARLRLVEGAGHDPYQPAMAATLVRATDHFAEHGHFDGPGAQWTRR